MSELVHATQAMIEQASGQPMRRSTRAVAVIEGERLLGVAGIYRDGERFVMFANTLEPMKDHKRIVVRAYRTLFTWCRARGLPVVAAACPAIAGSEILLEHLGFRHVPPHDLYVWTPNG